MSEGPAPVAGLQQPVAEVGAEEPGPSGHHAGLLLRAHRGRCYPGDGRVTGLPSGCNGGLRIGLGWCSGPARYEQLIEALEEVEDQEAFDEALAEAGENVSWDEARADLGWD